VSELLKADEAASFVRSLVPTPPQVGIVLGSGLGGFAETLQEAVSIPYADIPHFPRPTAVGHGGALVMGASGGVPVAVLSGRVHLYEGQSPQQVVLPVRALGRLGVRILVLTNAAGAIREDLRPGELLVIDDHINFMGQNPLTGPNEEGLGERFIDMSQAYDPGLRAVALKALERAGFPQRTGVYVGFLGPSYETPAEIRMARTMGAAAVGMSTIPEVLAARHMGLRVLGLSCLTNMAAGILPGKVDHREVLAMGERVRAGLGLVLAAIVAEAAGT
jgi:purine-nucleoside phosphorylase